MQSSSYHILPGDRKADAAGCVPYLKIKKRRLSACMEGWISEKRMGGCSSRHTRLFKITRVKSGKSKRIGLALKTSLWYNIRSGQ